MKLKSFFIIISFFLVTSCSSLQKLSKTSQEGSGETASEAQKQTSLPAWVQEELYRSENTLGVSARIEIPEDQSPVQGLILADAKAHEDFKKRLSIKLATWLVSLNKDGKITEASLKTFTEDLINNDLDSLLLIDKRFYDKSESKVRCYSLATLSTNELKQKLLEKILKNFQDAKTLHDNLESSWEEFLASLPMG